MFEGETPKCPACNIRSIAPVCTSCADTREFDTSLRLDELDESITEEEVPA